MGTTIGVVLISYDINKLHTEVKLALQNLGYSDSFFNNGDPKIYFLPNTTMWHSNKSSNQAMNDLKNICQRLGVKLEKAVTAKATEFVGI